jgi:hypothetical protein
MPYKVWVVGEEVLAADFNDYLQEQVVATFPNAAARDAAILAPNAGQLCVLADTNTLQQYRAATPVGWAKPWGSSWGNIVPQTALTPGAIAATVLVAPTFTLAVPAGRLVQVHAWLQLNITNAAISLAVQRNTGAAAETYGATGDFGGLASSNRLQVAFAPVFATTVANQVAQVKLTRTAVGTGPASDLVAGFVLANDVGPAIA